MALYTIFAWTAIVLIGGAYYWLYIRREPLPVHLLGLAARNEIEPSATEDTSIAAPEKRKRKSAVSKRRLPALQTNELITGGSEISTDDGEPDPNHGKSTQTEQVHDEGAGVASNRSLKGMVLSAASPLTCSSCRAFS
jgi:hypothetical protein